MPTLADPSETESARLRSMDDASRPPATPASASRRATPSSTLSLANARIPSDLPPLDANLGARKRKESRRTTARKESDEATSPPPPLDAPEGAATTKKPSARREEPPSVKLMNDRVALGDYTGALDVAERLLAADPNDEAASACADNCRSVLKQMYAARIGPLDRVPHVAIPRDQLRWLSIDHRAGFVLSLVDGVSSLEMILDVSGMPELDALRILADLAQQHIITLR
jgi:hypothetical protein